MDKQRTAIWATLLIMIALSAIIVFADNGTSVAATEAGTAIVELVR